MIGGHRFQGLWRNGNFLKLWAGETVSVFGSQISVVAIPLLAVLTFEATPAEIGFLTAAGELPALMLALFIGVWVDRLRRRPVMIAANLGRALLLFLIPLAVWFEWLNILLLYVISFLAGILTVFFAVGYQSYLPTIVRRDQLVEGNSRLAMSASGAGIIGPALAGGIVQLVSAAFAILLDAISYLVSVIFLWRIDADEAAPEQGKARAGMRREIGEGLRAILDEPILRTLGISTGIAVLFENILFVAVVLYITRELGLSAGTFGIVFAAAGVGYFAGAVIANRLSAWLGLGRAIVAGLAIAAVGQILIPLASGPAAVAVPLLLAGFFLSGTGSPVYDLNQVSLRQAVTPDRLRGRVNGSLRVVIRGAAPVGAILGGLLGEWIGLRPTLAIAAIGFPLAILVVWFSPVRPLLTPPEEADISYQ
ncbi:MAG: MFS transporter [Thermomicrobiales bacterium]